MIMSSARMLIHCEPAYSPSAITPSRKRRQPPCTSLPRAKNDASDLSKKRKLHHPTFPPARFWDELSKKARIPLVPNALRELSRRNARCEQQRSAQFSRPRRSRRIRARKSIAEGTDYPEPADQLVKQFSSPHLKQLKKFATHGGPDLGSLRGTSHIAERIMRSSTPSSLGRRKRGSQSSEKRSGTPNTTTTRSTGPYDRTFQQHLVDHYIFPDSYEYPDGEMLPEPKNMEEILEAIGQPRPSLSPSRFSREDFREFKRANNHATKESQVMKTVIPFIEGVVGDPKCAAGDIPFNNLDHLTDGTLVAGKPDYYYGARPEQIDRQIRQKLSGAIIPSTQDDLPAAPNFFLEAKGPDGSAAVVKRQITYDTALGERGQAALLDYRELEPTYNNKAHTIGCTLQDGTLKMYASHRIPPTRPETEPGYVLTQVKGWALSSDLDTFRQGAAAYRNARDWAKRQRDQSIMNAKAKTIEHDQVVHQEPHLELIHSSNDESAAEAAELSSQATMTNHEPNAASFHDSDTSADELSLDHRPPGKPIVGPSTIFPVKPSRSRQQPEEKHKHGHSDSRSFDRVDNA